MVKAIVVAIRNRRPGLDVVGAIVFADFFGQAGVAFFGFGLRHAENN